MAEELNIGADHEGDLAREMATTGELAGERLGEMATTMGDAYECEEYEPALKE